jgi:hypothetical protein
LHSPQQVIARSDSDEAISKRDCHALWARNDTFFVVANVAYFVLLAISPSQEYSKFPLTSSLSPLGRGEG